MFKHINLVCSSLIAFSITTLQADQPGIFEPFESTPIVLEEKAPTPIVQEAPAPLILEETLVKKPKVSKAAFKPFTGKVKGRKVRLRLQPDLESTIVQELSKGQLLSILEDAGDFWAVEAPSDLKTYVFRSFVLDGQIEGNRVNVRLKPDMEAPIVSHLASGDKIQGVVSSINNKWVEIPAPTSSRFYVAKDFIENCGNLEVKAEYEARLKLAKQQLETAEYFVESEMQKDYPSIDFDKMNNSFQVVIQEFAEFSDLVEKAKDSLAKLQEQFLDKRIAYLENRAGESLALEAEQSLIPESGPTDKMKMWLPLEEALYSSWAKASQGSSVDEYYEEQKLTATRLSGILEPYMAPVKCKPGDYILRQDDLPACYVYSTSINLQNLVGKKVTLVGSSRPNNNFAFPAYFVLGVEE
jgi:hypothetical protein